MKTSDFAYDLPDSAIAQEPVEPRDASRLLLADTLEDRCFSDLPDLLEPGDLVVVNRTRVRRARLLGIKDKTGGRVEALLLRPLGGARWEALVRPARKLRPGSRLRFGGIRATVVEGPTQGRAVVEIDAGEMAVEAALERWGLTPLPPYFHGELSHPGRYQTVYADPIGSAAAPTAGLHFTPEVLGRLEERGIDRAAVELDIGVDTFRPIAAEEIEGHRIHSERFRVGEEVVEAVAATRRRGGRVVAIGTTVVRALETAAASGEMAPAEGATDLFITPGYRFGCVDLLVTNFHMPGTTLIVLVAAFVGQGWRTVYETALERGYRFLSFGDAMLARRAQ
jgi:S-adenosylmethionine:tRNA ribosyltransferase-isomerase